jgi:capsule polysaccharide modification protein KpsS
MGYKHKRDKGFYYYWDLIERTARKYEVDLVATGRYTYIKTDGNYRLYKEKATGKTIRILIPTIPA